MSTTPTITQAIRALLEERLVELHTAMPGSVVLYNALTRRASVQPLLKRGVQVDGERVVETLPVVNEVPILFFGALGGSRIRSDLRKGDTVLLVFSEGSLDRWLHKGDLVDPEDDRRHALTDAFGIAFSTVDGGAAQIVFTETEIQAGGLLALALAAELADLKTRIANWTPVANDGGESLKSVFSAWPVPGTTILKGA
jgi:hypothetical protein